MKKAITIFISISFIFILPVLADDEYNDDVEEVVIQNKSFQNEEIDIENTNKSMMSKKNKKKLRIRENKIEKENDDLKFFISGDS